MQVSLTALLGKECVIQIILYNNNFLVPFQVSFQNYISCICIWQSNLLSVIFLTSGICVFNPLVPPSSYTYSSYKHNITKPPHHQIWLSKRKKSKMKMSGRNSRKPGFGLILKQGGINGDWCSCLFLLFLIIPSCLSEKFMSL